MGTENMGKDENEEFDKNDPELGRELSPEEMVEFFSTKGSIPKAFYPSGSDAPFTNCSKCHRELSKDVSYSITKHFDKMQGGSLNGQSYFEFALCNTCYEDLGITISKESLKGLEDFFGELIETELFDATFSMFPDEDDIEQHLGHCMVTCDAIDPAGTYSISGRFVGNQLILSADSPHAISEAGGEAYSKVLSKSTKEEFDKILDIIDIPPSLYETMKAHSFALV